MPTLKFKKSDKYHFLAALLIAIWLILFLVLIAPFDIAELPLKARLEIMPTYGLISFIGYSLLIPLQNRVHKKISKQPILFEILIIIVYNILVLIGSYFYYKSNIVNGNYSFIKFTFQVYYPIFFVLLPTIILTRWFINKKLSRPKQNKIILKGENKLDILQIHLSDLICVSSADNYIEVNYIENKALSKKLLRTTLKNIQLQRPELTKVHRSHLINPVHFKEWKNANSILLTQMEIPVSKSFKKNILDMNHSPLKANNSPLF